MASCQHFIPKSFAFFTCVMTSFPICIVRSCTVPGLTLRYSSAVRAGRGLVFVICQGLRARGNMEGERGVLKIVKNL